MEMQIRSLLDSMPIKATDNQTREAGKPSKTEFNKEFRKEFADDKPVLPPPVKRKKEDSMVEEDDYDVKLVSSSVPLPAFMIMDIANTTNTGVTNTSNTNKEIPALNNNNGFLNKDLALIASNVLNSNNNMVLNTVNNAQMLNNSNNSIIEGLPLTSPNHSMVVPQEIFASVSAVPQESSALVSGVPLVIPMVALTTLEVVKVEPQTKAPKITDPLQEQLNYSLMQGNKIDLPIANISNTSITFANEQVLPKNGSDLLPKLQAVLAANLLNEIDSIDGNINIIINAAPPQNQSLPNALFMEKTNFNQESLLPINLSALPKGAVNEAAMQASNNQLLLNNHLVANNKFAPVFNNQANFLNSEQVYDNLALQGMQANNMYKNILNKAEQPAMGNGKTKLMANNSESLLDDLLNSQAYSNVNVGNNNLDVANKSTLMQENVKEQLDVFRKGIKNTENLPLIDKNSDADKKMIGENKDNIFAANTHNFHNKNNDAGILLGNQDNKVQNLANAATQRTYQIAEQLRAQGGGSAHIQVNDSKLGQIDLQIRVGVNNNVHIEIKSGNNKVKSALEDKVEELRVSLEGHKLHLAEFKVVNELSSAKFESDQRFTQKDNPLQFSQQQTSQQQQQHRQNLADSLMPELNAGNNRENFLEKKASIAKNFAGQTNVRRDANGSLKVTV